MTDKKSQMIFEFFIHVNVNFIKCFFRIFLVLFIKNNRNISGIIEGIIEGKKNNVREPQCECERCASSAKAWALQQQTRASIQELQTIWNLSLYSNISE